MSQCYMFASQSDVAFHCYITVSQSGVTLPLLLLSDLDRCDIVFVSLSLLRPREHWQSIVMSTPVVCLSVREHVSGTTFTTFTNFLCMLPMVMDQSSSGRVMKSQEEGTILGFSSPLTMHCTA